MHCATLLPRKPESAKSQKLFIWQTQLGNIEGAAKKTRMVFAVQIPYTGAV